MLGIQVSLKVTHPQIRPQSPRLEELPLFNLDEETVPTPDFSLPAPPPLQRAAHQSWEGVVLSSNPFPGQQQLQSEKNDSKLSKLNVKRPFVDKNTPAKENNKRVKTCQISFSLNALVAQMSTTDLSSFVEESSCVEEMQGIIPASCKLA